MSMVPHAPFSFISRAYATGPVCYALERNSSDALRVLGDRNASHSQWCGQRVRRFARKLRAQCDVAADWRTQPAVGAN